MWTTRDIPTLHGKTAIVTGANTGLGYETALALYKAGAKVTVACRNEAKAEAAVEKMQLENGAGSLEIGILDLASLDSVKKFAENFKNTHNQLHILVNNAGVGIPPASKTVEGYELQFGVNFLGHFALTGRLYPLMKATQGARVVTVSSFAYKGHEIDFENLRSEKGYEAVREYCQSKLADLVFAIALDRRIRAKGDNVLSIAAQPGANTTELARHMPAEAAKAMDEQFGGMMKPWQGALPSLYAATSDGAKGGEMYEPHENGYKGYPALASIEGNAKDRETAEKLWNFAEIATGVTFP